jgi:hypothetical protein
MRKRTIFFAVSVVVITVVAVVFMLRGDGEQAGLSKEEIALLGSITKNAGGGNITIVPVGSDPTDGITIFQHPRLGFTLELPEGFSAGIFEEEEGGAAGETTLIRGPDTAELQIYATAFDEEGPLTPERIRKDLPDVKISAPQQVTLKGGMQALAFLGENEALGKTQEVWFVHDRFLYQLTTTAPMRREIAKIIGSMRFK